jgi:hypothetical protein
MTINGAGSGRVISSLGAAVGAVILAATLVGGAAGCSSNASTTGTGGITGSGGSTAHDGGTGGAVTGTGGATAHDGGVDSSDAATTLYQKYGGAPTITKVVDDAVTGLLADCVEAPYFVGVGTAGHDSVARLKSCLRLQFTVLLGGPGVYPGVNDNGDTCVSMTAIHAGLGIPGDVFDRFVVDLGAVLKADGVSDPDIATIAAGVSPLKTQVVQAPAVVYNACDAGTGDVSTGN